MTGDLGDDLDELVRQMVKDASKEGVGLEDRARVLKMASQHHFNMLKVRGGKKPESTPGSGPNMKDLRERMSDEGTGTSRSEPAEDDDDDEQT